MILTVGEQVALMRRSWPGFRVLAESSLLAVWEGPLRPYHQVYVIRIVYCFGGELESVDVMPSAPCVTVESPLLSRHPKRPDEPIPHHYSNDSDPDRPHLCLHDPREREWGLGDAIADTIVPWAIAWLACYEGWRATGDWTGGGRHATAEEVMSWKVGMNHQDVRPARFNAGAFDSLGRRIGTFGSFPLMAAASAGFSRPPSWRDWSAATSAANPWRAALT